MNILSYIWQNMCRFQQCNVYFSQIIITKIKILVVIYPPIPSQSLLTDVDMNYWILYSSIYKEDSFNKDDKYVAIMEYTV